MKKETSSPDGNKVIKAVKKPELWASLALILGFFLPWISNPVFVAPGYRILAVLEFFSISSPVSGILTAFTYLIPAGGIAIIGLSISRKPTPLASLLVGMLPIVVLSVLCFKNPYIFRQLAAGSMMVFIGGICLLLNGVIKQNPPRRLIK